MWKHDKKIMVMALFILNSVLGFAQTYDDEQFFDAPTEFDQAAPISINEQMQTNLSRNSQLSSLLLWLASQSYPYIENYILSLYLPNNLYSSYLGLQQYQTTQSITNTLNTLLEQARQEQWRQEKIDQLKTGINHINTVLTAIGR